MRSNPEVSTAPDASIHEPLNTMEMTLAPIDADAAASFVANDQPFSAVTLMDDTKIGELP